jgi:protein phosphatase
MKQPNRLEVVALSDSGLIRSNNEDAVFVDATLGIAILADGMGGYNAGEVASGMATTLLANNFAHFLPTYAAKTKGVFDVGLVERYLANEVQEANLAIFNTAQSQPQYSGMATTLVFAWFYENRMSVAHLGDSRLYRWRDAQLVRLTHDHSLLQEQIDSGLITPEAARHSLNRNLVTRGLGVMPQVDTEIHTHSMQPDDLVLLCSDGLTDMLEDQQIANVLQTLGADLPAAAEELVHLANLAGGRDNISVILVRLGGRNMTPGAWWHKLLGGFK